MTNLTRLTRPFTKKCRKANRPIYSDQQMRDVQQHVWGRIFPHAVELKAGCWREDLIKNIQHWLEQNFSKDDYRFDTGFRYLYLKNETDRNLIILAFNDIFHTENPLHRHRSQYKNKPRLP